MKEFIEFIVKNLVTNSENISIEEKTSEDQKTITIVVKVATEEIGKVIGKKGRTVQAIRTLLAVASAKTSVRYTLEVLAKNES